MATENDTPQEPKSTQDIVAEAMAEFDGELEADASSTDDVSTAASTDTDDTAVDDKKAADAVVEDPEEAEIRTLNDRLKELGVDLQLVAGTDNKIPHKNVQKIIRNAFKKIDEGHSRVLQERDAETGRFKKRAEVADGWDATLRDSDPETVLLRLAAMYPDKYKRYVTGETAKPKEEKKETAVVDDPKDPRPEQDLKDGFTPEQFEKRLAWERRQAAREARAEVQKDLDARFKPLDDKAKAEQDFNDKMEAIRRDIAEVDNMFTKTWREANEAAILKAQDEARKKGESLTLRAAAARVYQNANKLDRDKIRKDLIDEQNKAAAEAATGGGSPARKVEPVKAAGPRQTIDIVAEAIREAEGR